MRSSLIILLAACAPPNVINNNTMTNTTEVVQEASGCCNDCCEDDCCDDGCDTGDGGDGGGGDTGSPCDDFGAPEPLGITLDEACESEPDPIDFDPEVERTWDPGEHEMYKVGMTPVVGPMVDHDGDGRVDPDPLADGTHIVFTAYGSAADAAGAIVILEGATLNEALYEEEFIIGGTTYTPWGRGGVALGDLEGDGLPEACFPAFSGTSANPNDVLICIEGDGTPLFATAIPNSLTSLQVRTGFPVIGDMDGDGLGEIGFGDVLFDSTGAVVGNGSAGVATYTHQNGVLQFGMVSGMADMDGDLELELVVGNAVYDWDALNTLSAKWSTSEDGPMAVADMDGDLLPDVVRVGAGTVSITHADGTSQASFTMSECSNQGTCGAPTVADFIPEADPTQSAPEIGIAENNAYVVYDFVGGVWTEAWSVTAFDESNATGSSVFDFEADGQAEVVYTDENTLFILDGATGQSKLAAGVFSDFASGTGLEYAALANVDRDESTEIVVASNDDKSPGGWNGIRVLGSGDGDPWAPSRPVWNQYSYHITNIDDDLSLPAPETENWLSFNNYRTQDQGLRPGDWQADVVIQEVSDLCVDCSLGEATFYVVVGNQGLAESGDFDLVFEDGSTLHTEPVTDLASGETRVIGPIVLPIWNGFLQVHAQNVADECDDLNNTWDVGDPPC